VSATAESPSPDEAWEAAYLRFESRAAEARKFSARLRELGADAWPRDAAIVELFCGRGGGLEALEQMGFTRVEGVDLSRSLLAHYRGTARCYAADCRALPMPSSSREVLIVQGGLHHLQRLPDDLDRTLDEMVRVLRPGAIAVIVEPWLTPFLQGVHALCRQRWARRVSARVDALAEMIQHELVTYMHWLGQPDPIRRALHERFEPIVSQVSWGKLRFVGRRRGGA
jgi:SAM-dependent methyltransferase